MINKADIFPLVAFTSNYKIKQRISGWLNENMPNMSKEEELFTLTGLDFQIKMKEWFNNSQSSQRVDYSGLEIPLRQCWSGYITLQLCLYYRL